MRKIVAGIIAALSLVAFTGQSEAQDFHTKMDRFFSGFHLVKQRNAVWPQPFLKHDQETYRSIFRPMLESGWVEECTLSSVHFTDEGDKLNRAGAAKVAAILNNFPKSRRNLYVARSYDKEETTGRLAAVQNLLTKWKIAPGEVTLATTRYAPLISSGQYTESYHESYNQSLPQPSLDALGGGGVSATGG